MAWFGCLTFALALAPPATPERSGALVVLVEAGDADAATIDRSVRDAVAATGGWSLQPAGVTAAALADASNLGAACSVRIAECAAKLAALASAQTALSVILDGDGAGRTVTLTLIDATTGQVSTPVVHRVGVTDQLGEVVVDATIHLLAPEAYRASLEVIVDPPAAVVLVNGLPPRRDPVTGLLDVEPGQHVVEVRLTGYASATRAVTVARAGRARLEVHLEPTPVEAPKPASSGFLVGSIVAGSGAAVGIAGGVAAGVIEEMLTSPVEHQQREQLIVTGQVAVAGAAVGALALVIGGAFAAYSALAGGP